MYEINRIWKMWKCGKCEIEIIDDKNYFWVNWRDLETEWDYKNWAVIFDKCDPKNKNVDKN